MPHFSVLLVIFSLTLTKIFSLSLSHPVTVDVIHGNSGAYGFSHSLSDPVTQVDVFHGTSGANGIGGWGSSEVPIGASVPFGLIKLGPDSTVCWEGIDFWWEYNHYGGYFYNDSCIRAFSHTKAQGTGLGDAGSLGVMVTRKPFSQQVIPQSSNRAPYMSNFSHANETGSPGYYSVWLSDASTLAELTVAGSTSGIHRYTCYPTSDSIEPCVLLADLCHSNDDGECGPGSFTLFPSSTGDNGLVMASSFLENGAFAGDCGGVPIFAYTIVTAIDSATGQSISPKSGTWADGKMQAGGTSANSTGKLSSLGAYFEFYPESTNNTIVITIRVGISFTSLSAAESNLNSEQGSGINAISFENATLCSSIAWNTSLSTIVINNIGYTDEDVNSHKAFLVENEEGEYASFFAKLHSVDKTSFLRENDDDNQGEEAARQAAKSAACVWAKSTIAGHAWSSSTNGTSVNNGDSYCEAALNYLIKNAPSPTKRFAPRKGPLSKMGIPAVPHGVPPSRRLRSFYSSLYHALSGPTTYSDVDGAFIGLDGKLSNVTWRNGQGRRFSDFSLWDVYRSQTPLLTIIAPDASTDFLASMVAMWQETNKTRIPHWVWANCETGVMPAAHALAIIADGLIKNVSGVTIGDGLAMAHTALDVQDAGSYSDIGYVPYDSSQTKAASLTLDYAFDDGVAAILANFAGATNDEAIWKNRSLSYKNIWNSDVGGMCPRLANGSWPDCPPLDLPPILLNEYYTEGDGAQYTFFVSHDIDGLRKLFPSDAAYVSLLQQIFLNTSYWPTNALPNPWYWAGNEPSVMMPWQFALVNSDAWRTQYWVRWALDVYYDDVPDGVPGNDDVGELNAWAVWATLGLYPITATDSYILSSPCFEDVSVGVPGGNILHIVAHNFTIGNVFISQAKINGNELSTPFVKHSDLFGVNGGSLLEFWLSDVPYVWGTGMRV
jgi:putative alpha-1,2-mannosidase